MEKKQILSLAVSKMYRSEEKALFLYQTEINQSQIKIRRDSSPYLLNDDKSTPHIN